MKLNLFFSVMIFASSALAQASFCDGHLVHPSWPDDQLEMGLECEISSTNFGDEERSKNNPRLCFGILKSEGAKGVSTHFKTFRSHPQSSGGFLTFVIRQADGRIFDGSISRQDSKLIVNAKKSSFGTGRRWIESTIVDLENPSTATFEIYEDGFFRDTLSYSATYNCKRLQ